MSLLGAIARQAEATLADAAQLLGRSRDRLSAESDRPPAAGLPIPEYESLTAAQVAKRLDGLPPAALRKLRDHERGHANRKMVLRAIESALAGRS